MNTEREVKSVTFDEEQSNFMGCKEYRVTMSDEGQIYISLYSNCDEYTAMSKYGLKYFEVESDVSGKWKLLGMTDEELEDIKSAKYIEEGFSSDVEGIIASTKTILERIAEKSQPYPEVSEMLKNLTDATEKVKSISERRRALRKKASGIVTALPVLKIEGMLWSSDEAEKVMNVIRHYPEFKGKTVILDISNRFFDFLKNEENAYFLRDSGTFERPSYSYLVKL
ncbi:MAG: hypothetical protein LBL91_01250 [Lachnospiraceae bacterium]|nr:hypothetical protein [Lachnospiraceae bacterium]